MLERRGSVGLVPEGRRNIPVHGVPTALTRLVLGQQVPEASVATTQVERPAQIEAQPDKVSPLP